MTKAGVYLFLLAAFVGSALHAQDITGAWQGRLQNGDQELRMVFQVSRENNTLKAVMHSIDEQSSGIPASAVAFNGSTLKITLAGTGDVYEGKLSANREAITGTWTRGKPLPLNLVRAIPETQWAIPEPPKSISADAVPVFEVATIKPSKSPGVHLDLSPSGLFNATGTTLNDLIKFAYDLHPRQIVGGPDWLQGEKYDITGKPDVPGRPNLTQLKAMVQKLLVDRFQLALHQDKRELPVYAIRVVKSGAKLTENDSDPNGLPRFGIGAQALRFSNATMTEFARILQTSGSIFDRPVVDQTGLGSSRYDFAMKWTPEASQPQPGGGDHQADNADATPDLFTAFQDQLGLKLESTKALVNVLVIDHVERPSPN